MAHLPPSPSPRTVRAIAVSQLPGIARKTLLKLRDKLSDARDEKDAAEIARPFAKQEIATSGTAYDDAWSEARRCADYAVAESLKISASVVSVLDSDLFPKILDDVPDQPFFLTYVGSDDLVARGGILDRWNGIAVIGTRDATKEGVDVTRWLVGAVARAHPRAVIVSGLAEGIDVAGHRAALTNGLRTVALMAKDLRPASTYPAKHRDDAADIVQAGGALISEYLPEERPPFNLRGQFVERDRLQSALSRAVVAVQCGKESGTMHAMRAAAEQGRALFAFRFKERSQSEGSEALIAGTAAAGKERFAKKIGRAASAISSKADVLAMAELLGTPPGHAPASPAADPTGSSDPAAQQRLF